MSSPHPKLLPIEHTKGNPSGLRAALDIYRELVTAEARNPESQIIFWIDHSKERLTDEFRCFAIERAGNIVGYFQYSYFTEEHVFFFEYFWMRAEGNHGLVPSDAIKAIRDYLATNYPPNFVIVFDVAHTQLPDGRRISDTKRLSYFSRLGFRRIEFNYEYPVLQSYGTTDSYSADLVVRMPRGRKKVSASELRTILRCVYFKHYLRWDRPFLKSKEFSERERLIDRLYTKQISQIGATDEFNTRGDDRRSAEIWISKYKPSVRALLSQVFGPKMPRLLISMGILLVLRSLLGSVWLLLPFVVALVILHCLAEDTTQSFKLVRVALQRFRVAEPRQL
jgi:hypothetical protein